MPNNLDDEHLDTYDEWANTMSDILDYAEKIGYEKAYYLLKAADEGELIEVDGENQAVKNNLTYLQNFSNNAKKNN